MSVLPLEVTMAGGLVAVGRWLGGEEMLAELNNHLKRGKLIIYPKLHLYPSLQTAPIALIHTPQSRAISSLPMQAFLQ